MTTTNDIDAEQSRVDDFNTAYGSCTWVRYWTGTREDAAKYGLTDGKAWLLGEHTAVVRVQGESSCIALTHVDVIPGQPDDIEDDSHDLPELAGAAERVGEYIAANGDGIYDVIDGHPLYARDMEALRRAADHVWAAEQLNAALTQSRQQAATYANEIGALKADLERMRGVLAKVEEIGAALDQTDDKNAQAGQLNEQYHGYGARLLYAVSKVSRSAVAR